jgi:hypothetical protein
VLAARTLEGNGVLDHKHLLARLPIQVADEQAEALLLVDLNRRDQKSPEGVLRDVCDHNGMVKGVEDRADGLILGPALSAVNEVREYIISD